MKIKKFNESYNSIGYYSLDDNKLTEYGYFLKEELDLDQINGYVDFQYINYEYEKKVTYEIYFTTTLLENMALLQDNINRNRYIDDQPIIEAGRSDNNDDSSQFKILIKVDYKDIEEYL